MLVTFMPFKASERAKSNFTKIQHAGKYKLDFLHVTAAITINTDKHLETAVPQAAYHAALCSNPDNAVFEREKESDTLRWCWKCKWYSSMEE